MSAFAEALERFGYGRWAFIREVGGFRAVRLAVFAFVILSAFIADAGDDQVRVRAGICQDRKCMKRTQIAFAPATINVQVFVKPHPENRALIYGLVCDGMWVQESRVQLDGVTSGPLFIADYRDVGAGECQALAAVYRAADHPLSARSEALIIERPD